MSSDALTLPARNVPVLGTWDVVVCGGGPAGCAAALAAARHGAKTLLVEKYGFLGGAPVTQLVAVILSTNGIDFQGVWHTWARRLQAHRAISPILRAPSHRYPDCAWFRGSVDPEGVRRAWDELMDEAGVEQLLL
ncbi:MAG: FAD-dependent oxidoreductase, partial [Planctomycetota bacterium]